MRDIPTTIADSGTEPLHQVVLTFGRSMLPWAGGRLKGPRLRVRQAATQERYDLGEALITEQSRLVTIGQFSTALRMQDIDEESVVMLNQLESLVLDGEIPFAEFVSRVQNLFPRALERIDVTLRMKINALLLS